MFTLWLLVGVFAVVLLGSNSVHADQSRELELNVPSQQLPQSLKAVADAFDLQIVFFVDDTTGIVAPSLIGKFSAPEAFDALLSNTALEHYYVSGSSVVVRLRKPDDPNPSVEKEDEMIINEKNSFFGKIGTAIAGMFLASGASAQAGESDVAHSNGVMEEIVVTALKRSQSLQEVPASISAVGSLELREKGIVNMNDLQFIVPSLHFGGFLGSQNISIRGVGEFNGQPGVAVSLDGIYQARATTAKLTQLDIERVEVLRGPQGTLYGRNSNGGAVNFLSAAPTQEPEGYLRLGYAEFDEVSVEGVYSGPITDSTAFRIAANYTDIGEGWVENKAPGGDDLMQGTFTSVRFRLNSDLTDNLTVDLMYAYSEIDGPMDHYAWITDNRELIAFPGGVPQLNDAQISLEPREQFSDFNGDSQREFELLGLTFNWELPFGSVRSITAYQDYQNDKSDDRDSTDLAIYIADATNDLESFSQEFNLSGSNDTIDWVIGVFYADDESDRSEIFDFPQPVLGLPTAATLEYLRPTYDSTSQAVFLDATWNISDRIRVSGGVRRTEDELTDAHTIEYFLLTPEPVSIGVQCDEESDVDWSATTYRAAAQYDTSDNSNLYFTYSEGYKAGGIVSSECTPPYDPEFIDAYEVGYKGSFADGRTNLSAALFYYDYTDFQVAQIIGLASATVNAGDAEVLGAELELNSTLNEYWALNASLTWLDSEYGDFLNTDGMQPELGVQQLKGNRLNNSPETSVNLGVSYHTSLGQRGFLTLRGDVAYRSKVYFREFNDKDDSQDAYTIVNLNAIWESADGSWSGRLFAKNLTDEDYVTGLIGSSSNGGRLGSWGPPRQVGLELTRSFGAR